MKKKPKKEYRKIWSGGPITGYRIKKQSREFINTKSVGRVNFPWK